MLFDLQSFLQSAKKPYTAHFLLAPTYLDFGSFELSAPAECDFSALATPDGAALTLRVKANIHAECARCLDLVEQSYEFEREYTVRLRDLDQEFLELPVDEKGNLILEDLAFQEILYEVPPVLLCSADCQGLCPACGLKKRDCKCQTAEQSAPTDARLSILKQLLS